MKTLNKLIEQNRNWASKIKNQDPDFFLKLSKQQNPEYLWIGCSDSRVPANQIVGLLPGEVFVHRNVGNLVVHTDFNCLSVVQYAVEVLKVRHIIVCGHYGCGGVISSVTDSGLSLIDNWLRSIREVYVKHSSYLNNLEDPNFKLDRLCELNVVEQVRNISYTTILQNAWKIGQDISVHGWIYGIEDGLINDLHMCVDGSDGSDGVYLDAVSVIRAK